MLSRISTAALVLWLFQPGGVAAQMVLEDARSCDHQAVIDRLLSHIEDGESIEETADWQNNCEPTTIQTGFTSEGALVMHGDPDGVRREYAVYRHEMTDGTTAVIFVIRLVIPAGESVDET